MVISNPVMRRLIVTLTLFLVLVASVSAQTARWKCHPKYLSLEPVTDRLIKVQTSGGYGLVDYSGEEKVPCEYESIGGFREGYAILVNNGGYVTGIVNSSGNITGRIDAQVKPFSQYPYFSEGLLPVFSAQSGWGYVNPDGVFVIKCQYKRALPFSCGMAAVSKDGSRYYHIDMNQKVSGLTDDFNHVEDLVFAFSFVELPDGRKIAPIKIRNEILFRDERGRLVKNLPKIKVTSGSMGDGKMTQDGYLIEYDGMFRIQSISGHGKNITFPKVQILDAYSIPHGSMLTSNSAVGGLSGLSWNGIQFLEDQFDEVHIFNEQAAFVKKGDYFGVVSISGSSSISIKLDEGELQFNHYTQHPLGGSISVPADLNDGKLSVKYFCSGSDEMFSLPVSDGPFTIGFLPDNLSSIGETSFKFICEHDGVRYVPVEKTVRWSYSSAFDITCPKTKLMLDQNGHCSVHFNVENKSDIRSAVCSVMVDGKEIMSNLVFEPNQNRDIAVSKSINLSGDDSRSVTHTVTIVEQGCPEFSSTFSVTYTRFIENL